MFAFADALWNFAKERSSCPADRINFAALSHSVSPHFVQKPVTPVQAELERQQA